jgi:hypothetical protein
MTRFAAEQTNIALDIVKGVGDPVDDTSNGWPASSDASRVSSA